MSEAVRYPKNEIDTARHYETKMVEPQIVHRFHAKNGLLISVRPLVPADAENLVDLFQHLGPESRYRRFNIPVVDPDPDYVKLQAERLAYIRPFEGRAWLAFADLPSEGRAPVGGIRYVNVSFEEAEVSLVVRDDLQNQGIGTELLTFAGRKAYADGYRKLVGNVQSTNHALWKSLQNLKVPIHSYRDGAYSRIELDLVEAKIFHWRPEGEEENGERQSEDACC